MLQPYQVTKDIHVIPSHFEVGGMGFLPINAFLIMAKEPVLVDTGMGVDNEAFMQALSSLIDPKDLKWIWLTHDDADHTGSLFDVLEAAPNAQLISNSLAALRISTNHELPMHRVHWLNPGEKMHVGDRDLLAVRPPLFDNPTTITVYDDKSKAYMCGDCFGAILNKPVASANDVHEEDLAGGINVWASMDSPWVHLVDEKKFQATLDEVRQLEPTTVLSAHLPPARGKFNQFMDLLATLPGSTPVPTPNQDVLDQMLTQMKLGY